jgi:hypothetical protein
MMIVFNEQSEKHDSSIRVSRDSLSNVIDSSFSPAKQDFGRISIFRGMQIVCNEQSEKHESSIRVSRDSLSNVIDSSFDRAKQDFGRISTFRGMQIDFNEQYEKQESSIRLSRDSLSNVIDSSALRFQNPPAKQDFGSTSTHRGTQMRLLSMSAVPSVETWVRWPCAIRQPRGNTVSMSVRIVCWLEAREILNEPARRKPVRDPPLSRNAATHRIRSTVESKPN